MDSIAVAAPLSWEPSAHWDGNDGLWNSFIVQVGTPAQDFRVFPSTAGQETWIPLPLGCTSADPSDPSYCGYLRGTLPVRGVNSSGFETNQSSTWVSLGNYTLDAQEAQLGYGGDGEYGFDTVVWGNASTSPNLTHQVVAGIADPDFWLGVAGLGPKSDNFTNYNEPIPSFLSNLVNISAIPSLSWAYTAGASYRNHSPASLTLGGYDANRFLSPGLSVSMNADNSRPLQVGLQQISAKNTLDGDVDLLPTSTYHFIDSTLPHIWLPNNSVNAFVSAFHLTYDNNTDLFLVNETVRQQLIDLSPTITFTLGGSATKSSGTTQTIELPYAAFDLQASYPFYQDPTYYFPIRIATNDTQYTIGRTFLQEAYLIADWDRGNFTIAQASFEILDSEHLVTIEPIAGNGTGGSTEKSTSHSISGGAIAGIVIGAVGGAALIALAIWFLIRRKKQKRAGDVGAPAAAAAAGTEKDGFPDDEKPSDAKRGSELASYGQIIEAPADRSPLHEVDSRPVILEAPGDQAGWQRDGVQEMPSPPIGHESGLLAEAPGSEVIRSESQATKAYPHT